MSQTLSYICLNVAMHSEAIDIPTNCHTCIINMRSIYEREKCNMRFNDNPIRSLVVEKRDVQGQDDKNQVRLIRGEQ